MRYEAPIFCARPIRCASVLAVFLGLIPAVSAAQIATPGGIAPARPERPYRGLFGGGVGNTVQSLTFEGSLGGGFVTNPLAEQGLAGSSSSTATGGGASGAGSAALDYSLHRTRFGGYASYQSLIDYYSQLEQGSLQDRHVMGATVYFMPAASTRIAFIQSFKNFPEFSVSDLFDPELDQVVPANQDFRLSPVRYRRFGSGVEVSHRLSNRSRINLDLNYGHGKVANREWVILMGSGNINYSIGKGIALFLGYQEGGQRDKKAGIQAPRERQPRINAGVDLARALSFSRRTTVAFTTGLAGTQDRNLDQTVYHLVGSARVNREFGQTWSAMVAYNRGVRQIEPLGEPFFSDSVAFIVQGSFSRRVQFQSYLGSSSGTVGSLGGDIRNQTGSIQLSVALTRQLALATSYADSRFTGESGSLPAEAVGRRNTRSVRTSLQVWLPLFTRTKRP